MAPFVPRLSPFTSLDPALTNVLCRRYMIGAVYALLSNTDPATTEHKNKMDLLNMYVYIGGRSGRLKHHTELCTFTATEPPDLMYD